MPQDALLKQFMPKQYVPLAAPPPAPKVKPGSQPRQKPFDHEADLAVRNAEYLCGYAYKIIDDIYKDYQMSLGKWEEAFGEILTAVAIANEEREKTFEAVQKEHARDAAKAAFINNLVFSLLTIGAMAYVGEFVKVGLPKLQAGKEKFNFVDTFKYDMYLGEKILETNKMLVKSPFQFTQFQANVFGALVKDSGNRFVPLAFPKPPEIVPYRIDSPSGLEALRQDFNKNIRESKNLVLGEFKKVQQWLNQESEFGEAWLAVSDGSKEKARNKIVLHIEKLRDDWAKDWEFFGKIPFKISATSLAKLYERAWWATYILKVLTFFPNNKEMTPESEHFKTISQLGRGDRKLLERAIVDRLRELNVVFAETNTGIMEQMQRIPGGAPVPEISIGGAIEKDEAGEALAAYRWAKSFVEKASKEAAYKYFPPAMVRKLDPLRAAHY